MHENILMQRGNHSNTVQGPLAELRSAQALLARNRRESLSALNELFRSGAVPDPGLSDRYRGELIALDIAPGLTQFYQWLADR